jgi:histidine ammonia-lyase
MEWGAMMKRLLILVLACFCYCEARGGDPLSLGREHLLDFQNFYEVVYEGRSLSLTESSRQRLRETRKFVDYLLVNNIKVYGLTTGFADLRNRAVAAKDASQLSVNILNSHDAGIGPYMPPEVVLGAMVCRANALAQGNSAFKEESLQTLVDMVNNKIIPQIPSFGSLGASGDLAYLARLGRAMEGADVPVQYKGRVMSAKEALAKAHITPFAPSAKEGLALTNGTSFMASMLAIAYMQEVHEFENSLALQTLFLNSVKAVDAAFCTSIQQVRRQPGQEKISQIFSRVLRNSPFVDHTGVQNDYCIRCLPQILGPKIELIENVSPNVLNEINAITDNPLIFKNEEISSDIAPNRIIPFENNSWAVLSGGNFHGEYITTASDYLAAANAKMALTMERQMTYLLNPNRNQLLPAYLISDTAHTGLLSGNMILQYTGNALTQKIAYLSSPFSAHNITSGNESEDVVSYGATAALRLLEQLSLFHSLNTVYLTNVLQAYAIMRNKLISEHIQIPEDLVCEKIYQLCVKELAPLQYPTVGDMSFKEVYVKLDALLNTAQLRECMGFPVGKDLHCTVPIKPTFAQVVG